MTRHIVTLQDIADYCNVGRATVSGALRGSLRQASPPTIARIVAAAKELGYDPRFSHAARRLRYAGANRPVESGLVLLSYPLTQLHYGYYAQIIRGIAEGFRSSGHGLLFGLVEPNGGDLLDQLPIPVRRGEVDAALIFPTEAEIAAHGGELLSQLRVSPSFAKRPVVSLMYGLPGCSTVGVDDRAIGRLQARHLLELGHRELVRFSDGKSPSYLVEQRILGHLDALVERGLDPDQHLRVAPWVWKDGVCFDNKVADLLARWPTATGFMCTGDTYAALLHAALQRLGRKVPHDCSIIGADDCESLPDAFGNNLLSTIRLPLAEVGRQAASLIIRLVHEPATEIQTVTLPVELVARATTGRLTTP